jgi:hypothetical protein
MKKQYTYVVEYRFTNWDNEQTIQHEIFKSSLGSLDVIPVITEYLLSDISISDIHIIPLEYLRITKL